MESELLLTHKEKLPVSEQAQCKPNPLSKIEVRSTTPVDTTKDLPGLVHFNRARKELELATSIDEVKAIRDKAEAMRIYSRQAGLALEMQNMCAEIRLRAEHKAGQMLKEMGITQNSSGNLLRGRSVQPRENAPSLKELGISKSQSSRWQMIGNIPTEAFEKRLEEIKESGKELTTEEIVDFAKYLRREETRASEQKKDLTAAQRTNPDDRIRIVHGDFRKVLSSPLVENDSIHMILTDPPYGKEFLPVWKQLGEFAAKVLKPGKLLIAYSGNYHLSSVMNLLSENLQYVWTAAVVNGSQPDTVFQHRIMTHWKPILLFSKGKYRPAEKKEWFQDLIHGDGRSKSHHNWEQGIGEAKQLIEALTHEGNLIVDPFLGSGTNAVASKKLNRRFIGCDVDEKAVGTSLQRINKSGS
jgi:tRNA G37 N-methylase Trm5